MAARNTPKATSTNMAPPNITFDTLMSETQNPEPFQFSLKDSTRITFPDLFDVPIEDAEDFLDQLSRLGSSDMEFLKNWLSEEDFEAYKGAGLKLRQHSRLMGMVLDYYEASMGKRPEDSASAT